MPADYRKFIPLDCFCCIIDVVGWRTDEYQRGSMNVGVISNGYHHAWRSPRARMRHAWAALRGEAAPFLDFGSRVNFERFLVAIQEAAEVAFNPEQA